MAVIKIRIGGQWVTIGGSGLVSEANSYTDALIKEVNDSITQLNTDLGNTNDYVDNAFRDGVITEVEAKKIKAYLNTLNTSKNTLDQRTSTIIANENLPQSRKDSLTAAKSNFDSTYTDLVNSITSAIADSKATDAESADVDSKFTTYNNAVSLLTAQLELALDDITGVKVGASQQYSTTYTDQMKQALDNDISSIQGDLSDTQTYIDGSFKDGIIYDSELKQIKTYIQTLATDKATMDSRYTQIDGNADLGATEKTNMETAKTSYDTAYQTLVDDINNAIADQLATSVETSTIDADFTAYHNALSLLAASMEVAIDSIAATKGARAEANAKQYADELKTAIDATTDTLQQQVSDTNTYVDGAFKDGIITQTEAKKIESYLNTLQTDKTAYDNEYDQIYNNELLSDSPKTDLFLMKTAYDTSYQSLVDDINNAIADGITSTTESQQVDLAFSDYHQKVADLTTKLEAAADYIAQKKADNAEFGANNYTDTKLTDVDNRFKTVEASITQNSTDITLRVLTTEYTTTVSGLQEQITQNSSAISDSQNNIVYKVEIISSNGLVFKNGNLNTILSGKVMYGQSDVTDSIDAANFVWTRTSADSAGDTDWNNAYGNGVKTLIVTSMDVNQKATFTLSIMKTT